MIWITSDAHYNHKNICRGVSSWSNKEDTTRDFKTLGEMNNAIVDSINKYVQQDDELYFLGDWSFGGIESIYNFYKRLVCRNIHFIPGNHDNHIKNDKVIPNCKWGHHYDGFEEWFPTKDEPTMEDDPVHAKQLFDYLPELTTITYEKQLIVLCHYPIDEWEEMKQGSIMLHGHCHGTINKCEINTKYRRMDVGMDWKEFRPYSIDEIVKLMNKKEIKQHNG